ncbi:MAG: SRPBCC family protein [Acidimicrobiales bacterium]
MNLIHHVFDIQAPPETVFASITTADGLSSWWTTKVNADTALRGSLFLFTFRDPFNPQLRITEIESTNLVAWEGVSGHDAWGTTTLRFQLDRADAGTMVRFWHQMGADRPDDAVASANFTWGYYLDSLRLLCETGRGKPYQSGVPGARVGASMVE